MTTSTAVSERWVVATPKTAAGPEPISVTRAEGGGIRRRLGKLPGLLEDVFILLLVVWLFPVIVLAIGTPIALLVRFVSDAINRL